MASNWNDKHVLIAGGSSGLGLAMVRCLASQGAHLALIGRDADRLQAACKLAKELGAASVEVILADVCDERAAQSCLEKYTNTTKKLDLVIHTIGQSDRGHLLQLESSELERMFRVNVLSAFHVTKYCRPALQQARGSIVWIGSLASRLAPAGLGGYALTKFPLAAMRQQLTLELAQDGIHVTLVCPGPIRRDDAGTRYQEQIAKRGLGESLSKPGGGARVKAIDPDWLCRRILSGVERREREIIVPWKAKVAIWAGCLSPKLGDWLLSKSMRK